MTPVWAQLRQGITPEKVALTIALGAVIGVFPILGSTTLLCVMAGFLFKLNQPVIQLVNYLMYPLQFILLIPLYRAGEIFGTPHLALSIPQLMQRFQADAWQFMLDFGLIALGGIGIWCLLAPPTLLLLYFSMRRPLRLMASHARRRTESGTTRPT